MLIISRRHKIKSCKYIKIDLKTDKYTENIPKINLIYTVQNTETGLSWLGGACLNDEACASRPEAHASSTCTAAV